MKKGFTLIELLAVIVILAIIATIATPIILSIIEDTKKSATLRSAEYYLDAVETSVATATLKNNNINDGTYNILENGNICLEEYDANTKTCKDTDSNSDNNELVVQVKGDKPSSGTITITKTQISDVSLNLSNKVVMKNEKGELVFSEQTAEPIPEKTLATICTHDATNGIAEKTAGAKYKCKVKEVMEEEYSDGYIFYVLKTPLSGDTTINLIMDQNINSDGSPAGMTGVTQITNASKYNLVPWYETSQTNTYGPVTAMQFLYNATKDWTNIEPVNYTYMDKEIQGTTATDTSYTSFVSIDGVATITPLSGTGVIIGTNDVPLRTRMPIYASDTSITEVARKTDSNAYLYDNLDSSGSVAPYGYWTLSSDAIDSDYARYVTFGGFVSFDYVTNVGRYGVRPVINLKL